MTKDFPFFFQHDSMKCGLDCLKMICRYYGKKYSDHFLDNIIGVTIEGVSLLAIDDASRKLGFNTKPVNLESRNWQVYHFLVFFIGTRTIL